MKIVIHDASVLIDLTECDLVDAWCSLKFEAVTTSLIWREVNRKGQKAKLRRAVNKGGLRIEALSAELLTEVVNLRMELPDQISLEDASALFFASALKAVLLTSDGVLRKCASRRGVEVHGMLWVFDMLVSSGATNADVAADRLERLVDQGTSRLPKDECNQRMKKWRKV